MPFRAEPLEIAGVLLVEPKVFPDARGFFMETYKQSDFAAVGIRESFVQENHSRSSRGILRGLHFQRGPAAQAKLVRAIVGEIFDVAVDLRRDSPSFGKWVGATLTAENKRMLYLPPWCAHGFQVLSEVAEVLYKTSREYAPEHEGGIAWNDAAVGIVWPITGPTLSERDQKWPLLAKAEL